MRKHHLFIFTLFLLLAQGCASSIKYTWDDNLYIGSNNSSKLAIVDVLNDRRSHNEKLGIVVGKNDYEISSDKMLKKEPGVAEQISHALASHLVYAKVFKKVIVEEVDEEKKVTVS